jgi:HEPN domain-containing protein
MVTIQDARSVSTALAEKILPVAVILFGSVAKSGQGNDLDLLVVTGEDTQREAVGTALREFYGKFAIDYFVVTAADLTREFMEGNRFLRLVQREGKVLYMKEPLKEWVELAREDCRQAKYLCEGGFYRGACFHSQQAVEKALKARLLEKGWELEKLHNIRRLLSICAELNIRLEWTDREVDFLDSIYRGRYPAEQGLLPLNPPNEEDAKLAVGIAEGFLRQLGMTQEQNQEARRN